MPKPIPLDAPVTIAVLVSEVLMVIFLSWFSGFAPVRKAALFHAPSKPPAGKFGKLSVFMPSMRIIYEGNQARTCRFCRIGFYLLID